MSLTLPKIQFTTYPSYNAVPSSSFSVMAYPLLPSGTSGAQAMAAEIPPQKDVAKEAAVKNHWPTWPKTHDQLISLAKAAGFLLPAIALAKFAPGQAEQHVKELLPSDWKVWAKLGLGIASMHQLNKSLQWEPPPWLGTILNVSLMAGLMTGISRSSLRSIIILGPCMAALVQGTQAITQQVEKPLQDKFNIPPALTELSLSVLSMGAGFFALPKMLEFTQEKFPKFWQSMESPAKTGSTQTAKAGALGVTGVCGCCGGAPICLNATAPYGAAAIDAIEKHFTDRKKEAHVPTNNIFLSPTLSSPQHYAQQREE